LILRREIHSIPPTASFYIVQQKLSAQDFRATYIRHIFFLRAPLQCCSLGYLNFLRFPFAVFTSTDGILALIFLTENLAWAHACFLLMLILHNYIVLLFHLQCSIKTSTMIYSLSNFEIKICVIHSLCIQGNAHYVYPLSCCTDACLILLFTLYVHLDFHCSFQTISWFTFIEC
jgi:hypothetical protein